MGMPIREKQVCSILISWPHLDDNRAFGPLVLSVPYRWSLYHTVITAPSGPYRPLFRTVNTASSDPYSFLYPLLRFLQA